ncbi:hypothetical protein OVY48_12635 [Sphingobium sp. SA2]|jgi:hypothetical protein|uniref:hypothetical protein n=1 Tax=unclassified Sphingobium TaxID=2611147 RepID=UPI00083DC4D2|nr:MULTISPECIES: hypothetical protein [unclassified Sphingobium]AOF96473.1 hypothetical protein BSY17_1229 [Sphingobium sp. RAC03]MDT7534267.1 hypothetical protein [Sphingobium sp. SA2]PBN41795.1 hypothetical protein SxD43FB_19730 [Sphingobium sp. D43FB]|tara:strand:+ start:685 stop:999 length:315 start_codon:yes stop_codon:yes gene_type:complete
MNILWKGAAAVSLAIAGIAAAAPAQAQYHGGYRDGWRGDRDRGWDNRRWDNRRWDGRRDGRRWDGRRHWRGDRGYYRAAYRPRCWTQWRYDYYRDRNVRVRVCR